MDKGNGSWISCDHPDQCDLDSSENPRISQPEKEEAQINRGTDTSELNLKTKFSLWMWYLYDGWYGMGWDGME